MAQITSREELEEWFKDKPADWAQVIAARAALRVLPYALGGRLHGDWFATYSLTMFRATAISWATRNFPARVMGFSAYRASDAAYEAIRSAARVVVAAYADAAANAAADAAYSAACAAIRVFASSDNSADAVCAAARAANADAVWQNIDYDCDWLETDKDRASAAERLTHVPLCSAGEPQGWGEARAYAEARLDTLNQGYSVWVEWYNRRVEGNDAAFDIPGDYDRTEDKAILARLADATNEDFWGRGATYVNTTLQGWITQARERASAKLVASAELEVAKSPKPDVSDRINFFISYATVDEAMAREVEAVLAELGYTSIAQFKDFKQSSFVRSMREGLAKSERFIALYSKAYWSSDHCQSEWDAAYNRDPGAKRRKIVPFLLEAMDLRQQPLASEIVYEPLHGLSKDERKKAIKQMIEYQPSARRA